METPEWLTRLVLKLEKSESKEDYEHCAYFRDLINAIKTEDIDKYIPLVFDVKEMTKIGFFKKGMTNAQIAERVRVFFDFESVFDYSKQPPIYAHISEDKNNDRPFVEEF